MAKITVITSNGPEELKLILDRLIAEECPIASAAEHVHTTELKFGGVINADEMPEELRNILSKIINKKENKNVRPGKP